MLTNHTSPWSHHTQQHAWKTYYVHSYAWQNLASQSTNTLEIHSSFLKTGPYILCGKRSYSRQFKCPLLFLALSSDSSRINSPSSISRAQRETHLFAKTISWWICKVTWTPLGIWSFWARASEREQSYSSHIAPYTHRATQRLWFIKRPQRLQRRAVPFFVAVKMSRSPVLTHTAQLSAV